MTGAAFIGADANAAAASLALAVWPISTALDNVADAVRELGQDLKTTRLLTGMVTGRAE